jgi:hypothetical protein
MFVRMADGDIVKLQEIYELPVIAVFNHLSYLMSGGFKKTT